MSPENTIGASTKAVFEPLFGPHRANKRFHPIHSILCSCRLRREAQRRGGAEGKRGKGERDDRGKGRRAEGQEEPALSLLNLPCHFDRTRKHTPTPVISTERVKRASGEISAGSFRSSTGGTLRSVGQFKRLEEAYASIHISD